jgi:protein tyrosine/serine phosphatase
MIRLLREMPKPMLVHCKSGADRTGLAVTLYLHVIRGEPLEQARRALSWRYAHLSFGQAGVVHRMLDAYAADRAATGIGFEDWVATRYDPAAFNGR